jgi:hypothetical protein
MQLINNFRRPDGMALPRGPHKFDRLTITLVPTSDERSFKNVPSTFNSTNRTYAWRQLAELSYMLVPRKISSREIKVDIFVDPLKRKKAGGANVEKVVQDFIREKIQSEWSGLKFGGIVRVSAATPPDEKVTRGTIEEILGANLE